ncbi:hypothetical protein BD413DRAFT_495653 [Trametes elegans]|nr:hypothetical protein BD413DRAFT_495653 [Trametes elegans]
MAYEHSATRMGSSLACFSSTPGRGLIYHPSRFIPRARGVCPWDTLRGRHHRGPTLSRLELDANCALNTQDAAVELAKSVADVEEQKSRAKVEARHSKVASLSNAPDGDDKRTTSSKARLERAKAAVAAQAARAKREKAKLRRKARASAGDGDESQSQTVSGDKAQKSNGGAAKKRVTFG